jgi:hypothetical protein
MRDDPKDLKSDSSSSEEAAKKLRAEMELLQSKLNAAKIAFHNRTELDGSVPEYEDVAAIAKRLIAANYELQKVLYGEVKMKLSVSKLLRSGNR